MEQTTNNKKIIIVIGLIALLVITAFVGIKLLSKDNNLNERTTNKSENSVQNNSNNLTSKFNFNTSVDKKIVEKADTNGIKSITVPEGKNLIVFDNDSIIDYKHALETYDIIKSNDYYYISILEFPINISSKIELDGKDYNCVIMLYLKINDPIIFMEKNGKKEISPKEVYLNLYNKFFENNIYDSINTYLEKNKDFKEDYLSLIDNGEKTKLTEEEYFSDKNPLYKFESNVKNLIVDDLEKINNEYGIECVISSLNLTK